MNTSLGIYFHVPFCATRCDFCAFYEQVPRRSQIERYLAAMERAWRDIPLDRAPTTAFWGGGTPGLLTAKDLYRLGNLLLDRLEQPLEEWTVEMAPATVKADKVAALRELGVNRISLGVQSFQPRLLEALGRRQSAGQVERAIDRLRTAGIGNLNLDLIIAIPGQQQADLLSDLHRAIALEPEHLSTYMLTFEEDTALYHRLHQGGLEAWAEEEEAAAYTVTCEVLAAAGYHQYEIANHARPGYTCRHHCNTWTMAEWIGVGPSAASQYQGRRYNQIADLNAWADGVTSGRAVLSDQVTLTPALLAADSLIFGLRMNRGVDLASLERRFPEVEWPVLSPLWHRLEAEGLLQHNSPTQVCLTPQGRLFADFVGREVLAAF